MVQAMDLFSDKGGNICSLSVKCFSVPEWGPRSNSVVPPNKGLLIKYSIQCTFVDVIRRGTPGLLQVLETLITSLQIVRT